LILTGILAAEPSSVSMAQISVSDRDAAHSIYQLYESRFDELEPMRRGHWALRLYRWTGDPQYIPRIRAYGERLLHDFVTEAEGLEDSSYRQKRIQQLLGQPFAGESQKRLRRRSALSQWPEALYAGRLLYLCAMLQSLGLQQEDDEQYKKVMAYLHKFPFDDFLLNYSFIQINAANQANSVYYLKSLGLVDLETSFFQAFQEAHRETDQNPDDVVYENKIYGLTHIVIAASGYYQNVVTDRRFAWIYDYFEKNIEIILERTKPDVAAEVALCYLLAKQSEHKIVRQVRDYLVAAWDPSSGMIPSTRGKSELNSGEHRNVLAYMVLTGFDTLVPGPNLSDVSSV